MPDSKPEGWVLVDPKEALPCSLGVVVPESRVDELRRIEQEGRERPFLVRAVLSDHVPLAGDITDILNRPSYCRVAVNDHRLSIYLHHGGRNAVYFDLVGTDSEGWLDYIEVVVQTKYPSNCFWSARTAVSQLLDSMMRTMWLPLTIRRLDLYLEGDQRPLCQQLILPFTGGVRMGPLGGIHQYPFLAPYEALIREAITTGSPYYRLLCAYRLYEGVQPLRKMLRDLGERAGVSVVLPKPQPLDLEWLKRFGIQDEFLAGLKECRGLLAEDWPIEACGCTFLARRCQGTGLILERTDVPDVQLGGGPFAPLLACCVSESEPEDSKRTEQQDAAWIHSADA